MYKKVIKELTKKAIDNLRVEDAQSYKDVLNDMQEEFETLQMNINICLHSSTRKTLEDICNNLESYYRNKYKSILFPLFVPWECRQRYENPNTKNFVDLTKHFFIKQWKNNLWYCLPIDGFKYGTRIISVIPPEELDESIKGFDNPTMAMLDFYIHLIEEVKKEKGEKNPHCDLRGCMYNYGSKCRYEDIRHVNSEKRLCDSEKEVN